MIRSGVSSPEDKAVRCYSDFHDSRFAKRRVEQVADDSSHHTGHACKSGRVQLAKEAIPDRYFYAALCVHARLRQTEVGIRDQ